MKFIETIGSISSIYNILVIAWGQSSTSKIFLSSNKINGVMTLEWWTLHQDIEKLPKSNIRKDWKGYYCWYCSGKRQQWYIWWHTDSIWFVVMAHTPGGKERTELEWKKLLEEGGFPRYKITKIPTIPSIIEAYPIWDGIAVVEIKKKKTNTTKIWCNHATMLRAHLVRCNGYYTVIRISIIRNKRCYNVIIISIHLFGDNT